MHFIHEHDSGAKIVFGLDWSPLLGGHPERQGLQRARAMDATHYVLAGGSHGCAVGIIRLTDTLHKESLRIHSAAALFSKSFPHGAQACLMTMKDGACWMLVSHAGAVLSHTDRWYADSSLAIEALEPIRQRFPSLQLQHASIAGEETWPAWLMGIPSEDSVLKRLRHARTSSQKWFYLMLSVLVTAAATGYQFFYKMDQTIDDETFNTEHAWRQALREQSQHTVWYSYSQLNSVIQSWMQIPLLPMGWRLTKVQCESNNNEWNCSARFVRQHRLAMNTHLEQVKPPGWKTDFTPLEDAAFVWRVEAGSSTLDLEQPWMRMDWMSYLQRISAAFEHIQVGQSVLIPFKSPLDQHGQPLSKMSAFPAWTQRTLVLKGPLRSLTSLADFYMPVRWRRVVLNVDRHAVLSINRSVLTFELIGDMFESNAQ